jgi:citrate lyase subunit beta / citryl-CoA lyase
LERGADALILDLEDSVATQNKATARELVGRWLLEHPGSTPSVWVRVNAATVEADIASFTVAPAGVMVPGAEPALLHDVDALLTARERAWGAPEASIQVIPLIETARGLLAAVELAGTRRAVRLAIGRADLAAELGLGIDPEGPEFRSILLDIVIASAAAGISAPLAPTSTDFRDLAALRSSTDQLMRLGYRGRTAVHPAQLAVINEVFTPSADEIERARALVEAFERSEQAGSGVTTDDRGRMVDVAVVRAARELLLRAGDDPR